MITKAIVTLCNVVYALIIRWFMKTAKTNDKATIVGFIHDSLICVKHYCDMVVLNEKS